jgi:hypothetical protein
VAGVTSPAVTPKPEPTPNPDHPEVMALVRADLDARYAEGMRRYGVPLTPFNDVDFLIELYQEHLDELLYLRALIYEMRGY